jgi:hypothetical protein
LDSIQGVCRVTFALSLLLELLALTWFAVLMMTRSRNDVFLRSKKVQQCSLLGPATLEMAQQSGQHVRHLLSQIVCRFLGTRNRNTGTGNKFSMPQV